MNVRNEKILIFDGACGSNLHAQDLQKSVWDGKYQGCNEYLNLSAPHAVRELHSSFLEAGCTVIETNTFGANRIVLAEYGLQERVQEINIAAVKNAKDAIGNRTGRYIAGSIGPGTKLPSLGHISHQEMADCYVEQTLALANGGVDLFIVETCQDLMQAKLAIIAALDAVKQTGKDIPIMLSVTVEQTGTTLVGSDIAAIATTFEPFDLFSLGLNCATGPDKMEQHIKYLNSNWPGRISIIPNAGMPQVKDGKTFYPLSPEEFGSKVRSFVEQYGVSIVGGCCGTTPQHIRGLAQALTGVTPGNRNSQWRPSLSSLYASVECAQEIPPLMIGERMNTHGSRKFKKLLLKDDFENLARIGVDQESNGAHLLDVCTAYAGRSEIDDMTRLITLLNSTVRSPLVVDTTKPESIEAAIRIIPGRCLINSINLEDGGKNAHHVLGLVKRYGAAVLALTIDEDGMAMTADRKMEIAKRIYTLAVEQYGLRPHDLFFDTLTFTVGSGDKTLEKSAIETIESIRRIKKELPGVYTSLGLSNVSFGLPPKSRKFLNSVFLHEAIKAGLDAAIVDPGKIIPLSSISEEDQEYCRNLLFDNKAAGQGTPLEDYINHFSARKDTADEDKKEHQTPEEQLETKLMNGDKSNLEDLIYILMGRYSPIDIINQLLVPTMRKIGVLFGAGKMLLPFVLQSAEVMKNSVAILESHMAKKDEAEGIRVLLATVLGDVHDIGKNLVDIILSNNGYTVYNIGINQPVESIIEKAKEVNADIIGLSGLLVKSALEMQSSMAEYKKSAIKAPILLGGAALTRKFVAMDCAPNYDSPVVYCADAFDGLKAVQDFEAGILASTTFDGASESPSNESAPKGGDLKALITRDYKSPTPPFMGVKQIEDIDPHRVALHLNEQALFRGRWGIRKAKLSEEEYEKLSAEKTTPILNQLKAQYLNSEFIHPKITYGYFPCYAKGNSLFVTHNGKEVEFDFPRQKTAPGLCLADYFKTKDEGGDVVGFFVGTVGSRIMEEVTKRFESNQYHDYLILHGFAVEMADALASYWHDVMRLELGLKRIVTLKGISTGGDGERYGIGYPACPDLSAQTKIFELLSPEKIGVQLTQSHQMVPEATTSAIVSHHPSATYFSVR